MDFIRVLLIHHHLLEWRSVAQHRAEILVQPHNQILFARRFRKLLKPAECIVQRLAACYHRMDEHALTFPQWSLQNRPYVVTSKPAMGRFPELKCCTLPFAFPASLICEISRWRPIPPSKLEKNIVYRAVVAFSRGLP